ncbi:collagen alpha-1(III) chain-like [Cygnus olor]|uniref:collagen alpha-1(III) chain-like n=1 Tax=Cygnus olor TaxID=8869 RepID=UPI001ADE57FF|nr:collagen alpha-1(III) chain-like [Cygnus olor]
MWGRSVAFLPALALLFLPEALLWLSLPWPRPLVPVTIRQGSVGHPKTPVVCSVPPAPLLGGCTGGAPRGGGGLRCPFPCGVRGYLGWGTSQCPYRAVPGWGCPRVPRGCSGPGAAWDGDIGVPGGVLGVGSLWCGDIRVSPGGAWGWDAPRRGTSTSLGDAWGWDLAPDGDIHVPEGYSGLGPPGRGCPSLCGVLGGGSGGQSGGRRFWGATTPRPPAARAVAGLSGVPAGLAQGAATWLRAGPRQEEEEEEEEEEEAQLGTGTLAASPRRGRSWGPPVSGAHFLDGVPTGPPVLGQREGLGGPRRLLWGCGRGMGIL